MHLVGIYMTSITKMHSTMNIKKKTTADFIQELCINN